MASGKTAPFLKAVMKVAHPAGLTLGTAVFILNSPFPKWVLMESVAFAAPRADSWTLAQQAFARLDYPNAYRYALEIIKSSPQNTEARRLAAKSAKEMQRYPECLRLMQDASLSQATTDDVGLVGECAALSQYTSWSLGFLQQNVNVSANHDIASFWLGRYFYRRGDYPKAEKTLRDVAVLPARLEKERVFMLERTREVLRATQPQSAVEKPGDDSNSGAGSSSPAPSTKAAAARDAKKDPQSRDSFKDASSKKDLNGLSFLANAQARAGYGLFNGKSTPYGPDDQLEFESASAAAAASAIKTTPLALNDLYVDARVSALAGFATPMGSQGMQLKIGLEAIGGVTQSNNIRPFYAPLGESVRPTQAVHIPAKGWSGSGGANAEFMLNRNLGVGGFAQYQVNSPGFKYLLTKILGEGYAKLEFDEFQIKPFANYSLEMGSDSKRAGLGMQWGTDFKIARIGFFGLSSPTGYPLVRYSRYQPIGRTKSVILFTQNEGGFWELNLAPRVYINDAFNVLSWYRYVSGSKQSYVAGAKRSYVIKEGSYRLFQPSSDYNSVASDWTTELEWTPHKNFSVGVGVQMRKLVTTYAEESDLDNTQQYSVLLDKAGETYNRYFVEARIQF